MFGTIKSLFGFGEEKVDAKSSVVSALESAVLARNSKGVVNHASSLRNLLKQGDKRLSSEEKVRVVKALNKAKVRALMAGTTECYTTFRMLDSISSDVVLQL